MRLRDPIIPDWLGYTIAAPIAIALLPIVGACFALGSIVWLKRQVLGPRKDWSPWFAWYPVDCGWDDKRWLETVERRSWSVMADTQFRAIDGGPRG
jgi:hypothetical protein